MHEIKEIVTLKQVVKKIDFSIRKVTSSFQLAMWLEEEIGNEAQEVLVLFCLNTKHEINSYSLVHKGTLDQVFLNPRDIFSRAILSNANSIIIAHNATSNCTKPNLMDDVNMERIKKCSELLDIKLLDYLIVGTDNYYSYLEENKL
ncbi:DNA repair protein RadC [Enterococcus sp. AZ150]|uniref:JAB domain-containing protein n=1 Tax=Enterococcus sp. AZ150 TaxID=2774866 RepID=UPI003F217D47